jgi:hypothetical protein
METVIGLFVAWILLYSAYRFLFFELFQITEDDVTLSLGDWIKNRLKK